MIFLKRIIIVFIILSALFSLPMWSENDDVNSEDEINVVMDNNYPPYVFYDSEQHLVGILIDRWAMFEEKTGIKVNISALDWSDALLGMENGEYDVIDTIFQNPERELVYDFTKPYSDIDVSIFFHKNISGINTVESVKGFAVAAKKGDQAVNVLRDAGVENITLYDSYEDIIKAAVNNEVVVFVIDDPPAHYFMYKYGIQEIFTSTDPLYTGQFHMAVKKGNTDLISVLESGFSKISPVEEQAILDKWYGKSDVLDDHTVRVLQIGIFTIGAIVLILIIWNRTLRKLVSSKTADLSGLIQELKYKESKIQGIINSMPDFVFILDRSGVFLDYLSGRKSTDLIQPPEVFIGHSIKDFFSEKLSSQFFNSIEETIEMGETKPVEYSLEMDSIQYYEARYAKLNDNEVVVVVRNITERTLAAQTIMDLSIMDKPTALYNRNYFESKLEELRQASLKGISVLMVDMDGLKLVNDTLGHKTGDFYLKTIADLLKRHFVKSDFVARIGGDEFVVVLRDWDSEAVLSEKMAINQQIQKMNMDALTHEGKLIPFSVSIGFCTYDSSFSSIDEMIKCADDFMYREKLFHRQSTKNKSIEMLNAILFEKDFMGKGHIENILELSVALLNKVNASSNLNYKEIEMEKLKLFAQFHDVGKIGIDDGILFKPGKLNEHEYAEAKRHTEIGYRIAESSPNLNHVSEWIYKHHEWWDGNGYPFGIKGDEIPLACRIIAIADAYDVMRNDRPYSKARDKGEAIAELIRCSGTQFDPELVQIFTIVLSELDL